MESIRLLSHSSINVEVDGVSLLCDPWFFGKVFDESWCLVKEPNLNNLELEKVKYVWISHEHPDHFNIPTLKYLASNLSKDVTFIFRQQKQKNAFNYLKNLGFNVQEIKENHPVQLQGIGSIRSFNRISDSALLIQTKNRNILNLNDCMLSTGKCKKIKRIAGEIDYLFMQYSLAGFSGNPNSPLQLRGEQNRHLKQLKKYDDLIQPRMIIPFASFVKFCTPYNSYLNDWGVSLDKVLEIFGSNRCQILFNHDVVIDDPEGHIERSSLNLEKWSHAFKDETLNLTERTPIEDNKIIRTAEKLAGLFKSWPALSFPSKLRINLIDKNYGLTCDLKNNRVDINNHLYENPDVALPSFSFVSLVNRPWGADTLNISAETQVYNLSKWRWFLYCKHYLYKPVFDFKYSKYIPRVYSMVRALAQ